MPKKTISPLSFFKNKEMPKGQFKQAANDNNSNINSMSKALGSHFSSQQSQIKALSSNISNIEEKAQQTAKKVEGTNSLLQQSIAVQNNILKTLKMLVGKVENIEGGDGDREKGGDSLTKRLLKGMGIAGAAAFIGSNNIGSNDGSSMERGSGSNLANVENKVILETIRQRESGGNYKAQSDSSTASGAYQFIDGTWQGLTNKFNVGKEFKRAKDAPPEIQDAVADKYIADILKRHNGDVKWVPREWYAGPKGYLTDKELAANKGLTVEQYSNIWMRELERRDKQNKFSTSPDQKKESAAKTKEGGEPQNNQSEQQLKEGGGQVIQDQSQEAGIRKLPISPELLSVLERAAREAGVIVRVKSGGQPAEGEGGKRTGSTRHDKGMAADLDIYSGDRKLTPKNSEDLPIFKKFVSAASAAGATGIGAGEGYMDKDGARIHVGFGSQSVWGAGGSGQNAASWLRETVGESPGGETPGPRNTGYDSGEQPNRNFMRQQNPMMGMMNPLAGIGGLFGPKGAAIGGIAGMLLPTIENILGNIQGDNRAAVMQPGTNYEQAKAKSTAIDRAAVSRETQTQTSEPPKQQQSEQQNQQRSNEVTATQTDTRAKPEWVGNFMAGIKHTYLDFDGKMIYI
jgi:hypothetical protein